MKKVIWLILVVVGLNFVQPASAEEAKSLVIIDSYFDSKVKSPMLTCMTLNSSICTDIVTVTSTSLTNSINHGNAMAEVAKIQNSNLSIIVLRGATPSTKLVPEMNAGNFIDALRWVDANSTKVGAVSFSRYFNGGTPCSPAVTNTSAYGGVAVADKTIRALIFTLKTKGIPVFAATGNTRGTTIDYPACITDIFSVSTGGYDAKNNIIPTNAYNADTDYLADYSVINYKSNVLGAIPQTTSSATVAVAAQWLTNKGLVNKVVSVKK